MNVSTIGKFEVPESPSELMICEIKTFGGREVNR